MGTLIKDPYSLTSAVNNHGRCQAYESCVYSMSVSHAPSYVTGQNKIFDSSFFTTYVFVPQSFLSQFHPMHNLCL